MLWCFIYFTSFWFYWLLHKAFIYIYMTIKNTLIVSTCWTSQTPDTLVFFVSYIFLVWIKNEIYNLDMHEC